MIAYDIALFIHMIGVIAMFSGFAIYQRAGVRLRSATDQDQVRSWLGLLESTNPMFASGSLMLLVSGVYMMVSRWRAPLPWIVVAVVALLTISIVGATVSGRHVRRMRAATSVGVALATAALGAAIGARMVRSARQAEVAVQVTAS